MQVVSVLRTWLKPEGGQGKNDRLSNVSVTVALVCQGTTDAAFALTAHDRFVVRFIVPHSLVDSCNE